MIFFRSWNNPFDKNFDNKWEVFKKYILYPKFKENFFLIRGYIRNAKDNYPDDFVPIPLGLDEFEGFSNGLEVYKDIHNKFNHFLVFIEKMSDFYGKEIEFHSKIDFPIAYAKNQIEFKSIIYDLKKSGYITADISDTQVKVDEYLVPDTRITLTLKGLDYIKEKNPESKQIFVAMQFRESETNLREIYNQIKPAIEEQTGFELSWMGRGETEFFPGKIDDEIIAQIRKSRFMIVDITYINPNVFYEAGYGKGIGKEVLFTCEENYFEEHKNEIPFDMRQYHIFTWKEDNLESLKNRILGFIESRI